MEKDIHRTEADACPHCGYKIDAHSHAAGQSVKPQPNDTSICFKCAGWNKYDENLKLAPFTDEDKANSTPELLAQMEDISNRIRAMRKNLN